MSGVAMGRWLLIAAAVAVAGTVTTAVVVLGTPGEQRLLREDERRVSDLDDLKDEVEEWARQRGALPGDLAVLARRPGVNLRTKDPFTAQPYEYEVTGPRAYRLCATFATDTSDARAGSVIRQWRHPRGRHCFDRELPKR